MEQIYLTGLLLFVLFLLLGGGVWIGLSLMGVALFAMELFTTRPAGDAMVTTIWGSSSSWTLTALPLFIWMGEILFRTRLSQDMFTGLAPWLRGCRAASLHTNIIGCAIFAAVAGSSAATCATIGKMTLPELQGPRLSRGPDHRHSRRRRHARAADPALDHHDRLWRRCDSRSRSCSSPASCPGIVLAALFMGYVVDPWPSSSSRSRCRPSRAA